MKLTSEEVFNIVQGEQEYTKKWDLERSSFPESHMDADKSLETWLFWMEEYMAQARKAATAYYDKAQALDHLRKVLSLGFNAAQYHGLPERNTVK